MIVNKSLYSIPNKFGLYPSEYNYIEPFKRPLSSTTPTIIERDTNFEIAIGGSGGSMIPTSTMNVGINGLCSFLNMRKIILLLGYY